MQVHTENELKVTRGERWEEGRVRKFGMDLYTHTTVFKMDDPQGLLYSAGNCSVLYGSLGRRRV